MDIRARLASAAVQRTRVHSIDLQLASLAGADLCGLHADALNLSRADLRGARLRDARLETCRLEQVQLDDADASFATLRQCTLDGAHAPRLRLDGARFEDSTAGGAVLAGASLREAQLTESCLDRALLVNACFVSSRGDGVSFRGADLRGASFVDARLDEADFRGADLTGANLSDARFRSADFRGAILEGARFDNADCTGSWFDDGAGPYAEIAADVREKEKSAKTSLDEIAVAALRNALTSMPEAFAARDGPIGELIGQIRAAVDQRNASTTAPAADWKPWLESLMNVKHNGQPLDLEAAVEALNKGTGGLKNLLAEKDSPVAEIVGRMQRLVDALGASGDQPPEAWKAWLEPLMKMTNEGRPIEGKALLDALAAFAQSCRPQADDAVSPTASDRKDPQQEH